MIKKFTGIFLAFLLVFGVFPAVPRMGFTAQAGYGTSGRFIAPIQGTLAPDSIPISSRAQLEAIKNNLSGNYHLTGNLSLSGADWEPIGTDFAPFTGVFDGRGYEISNLKITPAKVLNKRIGGLFGYIEGATIKNLGMAGTRIELKYADDTYGDIVSYAGAVCAYARSASTTKISSIANCYNWNLVQISSGTNSSVGGICGGLYNSEMINCFRDGGGRIESMNDFNDITMSINYAGGMCGYSRNSSIIGCYSDNTTNPIASYTNFHSYAGGIVGYGYAESGRAGIISRCFNSTQILSSSSHSASRNDGNSRAGGIAGELSANMTVEYCYHTGSSGRGYIEVGSTKWAYAGGIAGINRGSIVNSYNTALALAATDKGATFGVTAFSSNKAGESVTTVAGPVHAGCIAGYNYGSIKRCYNVSSVYSGMAGTERTPPESMNPSIRVYAGAISGGNVGDIEHSYWNHEEVQRINNLPLVSSTSQDAFFVKKAIGIDSGTTVGLHSKSTVEMRAQDGFPGFDFNDVWEMKSGINSNFPVLRAFNENKATLFVNKNGAAWDNHNKTFTLKDAAGDLSDITMTGTGGAMTVPARNGTWNVYDGLTDTGKSIVISGNDSDVTLDYYSVSFKAENKGIITGGPVSASATYKGNPIASGDIVPGGGALTITATTGGNPSEWSGAGTNNETTSTEPTNVITIANLSTVVDAVCTVKGEPYNTSINPENHTFPPVVEGYTVQPAPHVFTFKNEGTTSLHDLTSITADLKGTNAAAFEISAFTSVPLAAGASTTISVRPKTGLSASNTPYTATLVISSDELEPGAANMEAKAELSFTVNPYIPVDNIIGIPEAAFTGNIITLNGTVLPGDATNQTIAWSLVDAGTTGADFTSAGANTLTTTATGTVKVQATIINGKTLTTPYEKVFEIKIIDSAIVGSPSDKNFGTVNENGYSAPAIQEFGIRNITNNPVIVSSVKLDGADTDAFTLSALPSALPITLTDFNDGFTVSVQPKTGLPAGNYDKKVYKTDLTITYDGSNEIKIPLSFTVEPYVSLTVVGGQSERIMAGSLGSTAYNFTTTQIPDGIDYELTFGSFSFGTLTPSNPFTINNKTGSFTIGANVSPANTYTLTAEIKKAGVSVVSCTFPLKVDQFVAVTGIKDVPASARVGEDLSFDCAVEPENASFDTIVWSVANAGTTGATITNNVLRATGTGTATVTATIMNGTVMGLPRTENFTITINPAFTPVTDITGIPAVITVGSGTSGTPQILNGTVVPSNATNKNIEWSVVAPGATGANITSGNVLNTTAAGTAIIRARIVKGADAATDFTKDFTIMVNAGFVAVTNITNVPAAGTVGTPVTLSGTVVPANATNQIIEWSLGAGSTAAGASVSGGKASATGAGTVKVTATIYNGLAGGGIYTRTFDVNFVMPFVPVTNITGVPAKVRAGTPLTLSGTVEPSGATNKNIAWSIVNAGSTGATLASGNTVLHTESVGTVKIRATIANGLTPTTPYTKDFDITIEDSYVPVTDITGLPAEGAVGYPLTLSGTVVPNDATNKNITWELVNAGGTGASLTGNTLTVTGPGTVRIRAVIVFGLAGANFTKEFDIEFSAPVYTASLTPLFHNFPPADAGYSVRPPQQFIIKNTGTGRLANLSASLGTSHYVISQHLSKYDLDPGETAAIFIRPADGLSGGTYSDKLTIASAHTNPSNIVKVEASLNFVVNPAAVYAVSISPSGTLNDPYIFRTAILGYAAQSDQIFTVTNTGNREITGLKAALTGSFDILNAETLTGLSSDTLAPNGTATLRIRPKNGLQIGTHSGTLTITGNNGVNRTVNIRFTVSNTPTYTASITPASHTFPAAAKPYGTQNTQAFTLRNTGTEPLTDIRVSLGGVNFVFSPEPAITALNPGGTAVIHLRPVNGLEPLDELTAKSYTDALTVRWDNDDGKGLVVNIGFTVNPTPLYRAAITDDLDFGEETEGYAARPAAKTFTLTNTGNQPLAGIEALLPLNSNFEITAKPAATLAVNGTTTIGIRPKSGLKANNLLDVVYSEALQVKDATGSVNLSRNVKFTVLAPTYEMDIKPSNPSKTYVFPSAVADTPIVLPPEQTFTLSNTGTGKLENIKAELDSGSHFAITTNPADALDVKRTSIVSVRPKLGAVFAAGTTYADKLTITWDNGAAITVNLQFTVDAAATYKIEIDPPGTLAFDPAVLQYAQIAEKQLSIRNIGSGNITGLSASLKEGASFEITKPPAGSLNTAAAASVSVRPKLNLPVGNYTDELMITGNNGINEKIAITFNVTEQPTYTVVVNPSGTHIFPAAYGALSGTQAAQPFTITNNGNQAITGLKADLGSGAGSSFEVSAALSQTGLPAAGSATISIRPKANLAVRPAPYTDKLIIRWDKDDGKGIEVNLSFRVTETAIYTLSVTPGTFTFDPGTEGMYDDTAVPPKSFTLTNTGTEPITGLSAVLGGANFEIKGVLGSLIPGGTAVFTANPKYDLKANGAEAKKYEDIITIAGSNGINEKVSLSFTVNPPPKFSISIEPRNFTFRDAPLGYAVQPAQVFTITNTGNRPITGLKAMLSDISDFERAVNLSGETIPAGGTATISIRPKTGLALTAGNPYTDTLFIDWNEFNPAVDELLGARLRFTVIPPSFTASVTPDAHVFPPAAVGYGAQTPRIFTVTNTGNQPLANVKAALDGMSTSDFVISADVTPSTIPAGGTASFSVRPETGLAENENPYTDTLRITWDNGGTGLSVKLDFIVTATAEYTITLNETGKTELLTDYTFTASAGYTSVTPLDVTVSNTGNRATGKLTISNSGGAAGKFTILPREIENIGIGGTYRFTVEPAPGLDFGVYTETVSVTGDNGISISFTVNFEVLFKNIVLEHDNKTENKSFVYPFGAEDQGYDGNALANVFTIKNTSGGTIQGVSVSLDGTDADSFILAGAATAFSAMGISRFSAPLTLGSLAPGQNVSFTVKPAEGLEPKNNKSTEYKAAVVIRDDGGNILAQFDVSFIVNPITPSFGISVTPKSYIFPEAAADYPEQAAADFVIKNTGNQILKRFSTRLANSNSPFEITRTTLSGDALGVNESITVSVRPKNGLPVSDKPYTDTLFIRWENDGGGVSVPLSFAVNETTVYTFALNLTAGAGGTILSQTVGYYPEGAVINIGAAPLDKYMFEKWTSSGGGTFENMYRAETVFTMPGSAATLTAHFMHMGEAYTYTEAALSSEDVSYDKNFGRNVSVTLRPGSYTLRRLRYNNETLVKNIDYSVTGHTYTFHTWFLDWLDEGVHRITFEMTGGKNPVIYLSVRDSTPPGAGTGTTGDRPPPGSAVRPLPGYVPSPSYTPDPDPVGSSIGIDINGRRLNVTAQAQPVFMGPAVFLPVRGVFEALGYTLTWNSATQTATLRSSRYTIVITVGSQTFTTNGNAYWLESPAQIIGGNLMMPLRPVVESVGGSASMDRNNIFRINMP